MKTNRQWRRFDGKKINGTLYEEVENVLRTLDTSAQKLTVCIGTDSQVFGSKINYASVVVFYKHGKGGFMYINNNSEANNISVKERMLNEVAKSIEVAFEISQLSIDNNIDLEIHADINTNPNFKSNAALRDAMGYIIGCGFVFKAKTMAYASSSCANKWTR